MTWTPPSRNGHVIRCVHGWRSLVWVSTWIWPDSGSLAVRLYSLPPRRTSRRWEILLTQVTNSDLNFTYINCVQVLTIWFPHSTPGGPCEMIWLCLSLQVVVVPITSWFGSTCQGGFNLCSAAVILCDLLICSPAVRPTQLNVRIWFSINQNGYSIYVRLYASLNEHY